MNKILNNYKHLRWASLTFLFLLLLFFFIFPNKQERFQESIKGMDFIEHKVSSVETIKPFFIMKPVTTLNKTYKLYGKIERPKNNKFKAYKFKKYFIISIEGKLFKTI